MKTEKLREMTKEDLQKELLSLNREHFNLRMQKNTGNVRPHLFKQVKRNIARIKTVLSTKVS